jgi:hypothetical protein
VLDPRKQPRRGQHPCPVASMDVKHPTKTVVIERYQVGRECNGLTLTRWLQ